jgi:acyl-CoA synthetase (NDP forming)
VIAIIVPRLAIDLAMLLRAVRDAAATSTIPVLAVVMPPTRVPADAADPVPVYDFPEDAARALAHAARHYARLTRATGRVPELPDVGRDEAAGLLAAGPDPRWLAPEEIGRLFDCYGLPLSTVERTVGGGVAELLVGVVHDPLFGPVLACSVGGPAAELLRDVAVRITPLTDADAADMVRSLAAFPLLDGYGGAPRADVAAMQDLLLRVSALVDDHPEVAELDCRPVIVRPAGQGVAIVDARVRIQQASAPALLGARQP